MSLGFTVNPLVISFFKILWYLQMLLLRPWVVYMNLLKFHSDTHMHARSWRVDADFK
jgi:hypothetical protein